VSVWHADCNPIRREESMIPDSGEKKRAVACFPVGCEARVSTPFESLCMEGRPQADARVPVAPGDPGACTSSRQRHGHVRSTRGKQAFRRDIPIPRGTQDRGSVEMTGSFAGRQCVIHPLVSGRCETVCAVDAAASRQAHRVSMTAPLAQRALFFERLFAQANQK